MADKGGSREIMDHFAERLPPFPDHRAFYKGLNPFSEPSAPQKSIRVLDDKPTLPFWIGGGKGIHEQNWIQRTLLERYIGFHNNYIRVNPCAPWLPSPQSLDPDWLPDIGN